MKKSKFNILYESILNNLQNESFSQGVKNIFRKNAEINKETFDIVYNCLNKDVFTIVNDNTIISKEFQLKFDNIYKPTKISFGVDKQYNQLIYHDLSFDGNTEDVIEEFGFNWAIDKLQIFNKNEVNLAKLQLKIQLKDNKLYTYCIITPNMIDNIDMKYLDSHKFNGSYGSELLKSGDGKTQLDLKNMNSTEITKAVSDWFKELEVPIINWDDYYRSSVSVFSKYISQYINKNISRSLVNEDNTYPFKVKSFKDNDSRYIEKNWYKWSDSYIHDRLEELLVPIDSEKVETELKNIYRIFKHLGYNK